MNVPASPVLHSSPGELRSAPILGGLSGLGNRAKAAVAAGVILLMALVTLALVQNRQPEWRVLYANLSDKDGGSVIAALSQLNIQHRISEGGAAIMVPATLVHEARLKLATQGLPKGGAVGFELMENQKFGVTQFQERLNFQRGLEGELARSIMALSAVQSARVHLALPQQTAFLREQQKPSASVLLTLHGGRALDRGQIAGIVHLVGSSVSDLHPDAVSVIDQHGNLLSRNAGALPNGLDATQLQHVQQVEQGLATRILAIVEPLVGVGNIKAQITADVDFTQSESTAELYAPNQGNAPAAIRSQQLSEAPGGHAGPTAIGIPGTTSNQPPATVPSPINGSAQVLQQAPVVASGSGVKRDAITNYEVDKTVRVVRNATGTVKRLSAAVIINHAQTVGPDGKPLSKPLTAAQMEQITALVREAIGYNKDRGDTISVANAPFSPVADSPGAPDVPFWQQPQLVDAARSAMPWIAFPLLALIIVLGLIRPALKIARSPVPVHTLETTVQDPLSLPIPPGGAPGMALLPSQQQGQQAQLDDIRQLARQNPATVANVVRNWVNQPG